MTTASSTRFTDKLKASGIYPYTALEISTMQINTGGLCNQSCKHCHIEAGPDAAEMMSREVFQHCLKALRSNYIQNVDITGGAPELNPAFRWFVTEVRRLNRRVIHRCNLTVIDEPGQSDLIEFLAKQHVEVVASLPALTAQQTDAQRGEDTFGRSIQILGRFNDAGYGHKGSGLILNIITNPIGAFLPPEQKSMEAHWNRQLWSRFGIIFNNLLTMSNTPVGRFKTWLESKNVLDDYNRKLRDNFNPAAAKGCMCRNMISVDWRGFLYDCDFNLALDLKIESGDPLQIEDFDMKLLKFRKIITGEHCFGCTAGNGSSFGGAILG